MFFFVGLLFGSAWSVIATIERIGCPLKQGSHNVRFSSTFSPGMNFRYPATYLPNCGVWITGPASERFFMCQIDGLDVISSQKLQAGPNFVKWFDLSATNFWSKPHQKYRVKFGFSSRENGP
jgi:hypothetical protein